MSTFGSKPGCSSQVHVGAQPIENRSTVDVERFLSLIRFEKRELLEELPINWDEICFQDRKFLHCWDR